MTLTTATAAYITAALSILAFAPLLWIKRSVNPKVMDSLTTFGGAFLLASCFINLVPHLFVDGATTPAHFKIGATVMVGFIVQLVLESLTHGAEHGHWHATPSHNATISPIPLLGLMIGLCLHSFMEGIPLVDIHGDVHQGLLWGIVLHNIPITLVLIGLMSGRDLPRLGGLLLLVLLALMTPAGSLCARTAFGNDSTAMTLLMGLVVGILLHVSVSILFNDDHHKLTAWHLCLILLACVAAYLTPGCPEIY